MSAPSGIKVPASLASAFSAAVIDSDDTRALVFVIEGGAFGLFSLGYLRVWVWNAYHYTLCRAGGIHTMHANCYRRVILASNHHQA